MDVDLKLPVVVLNGEELLNGVFVFYDIGVPCAAILIVSKYLFKSRRNT